ncbi:MAG: hypothetical protein ACI9J3_003709 [Parvicellaceae bacterium]|jgi:hypothetical protein
MKMFQQIRVILIACSIWTLFFSGNETVHSIDGIWKSTYVNPESDFPYSTSEFNYKFSNGKFEMEKRSDSACFYVKGRGKYKIVDSLLILSYQKFKNKEQLDYTHVKGDTTEGQRIFIVDVKTSDDYYHQTYTSVGVGQYHFGTCLTHGGTEIAKFEKNQQWEINYISIGPLKKGMSYNLPIKCGQKNLHKIQVNLDKVIPTYHEHDVDTLQILKCEGNQLILKEVPPAVFLPMIKEWVENGEDIDKYIPTYNFIKNE